MNFKTSGGKEHGLRWSDESGFELIAIHIIDTTITNETCRITIVFMNAPIAPYEFIRCEFNIQYKLKTCDVLKQLPTLCGNN